MISKADYKFDLDEEMIETLHREFLPERVTDEFAKGMPSAQAKDAFAEGFFKDFGRRWMARTIELGEKHDDRTYEVLREVVAKTGYFKFPYMPERFIEIAYLSTQPIYSIPIVEAYAGAFVFKMAFCDYYKGIRDKLGDDVAGSLHCRHACLSACDAAFRHFGFDVTVGMDATMPKEGFCQFRVKRLDA
ncbi:MAG: hypothetical protein HY677_05470 [Chloroflexi bacterium]|nr:hypothetical protein [Chloroflexota bacterium]